MLFVAILGISLPTLMVRIGPLNTHHETLARDTSQPSPSPSPSRSPSPSP